MARRGENIRKRKDGRWEGRYIHGYDESGKAKYRSLYAKTYSDCKKNLSAAKSSLRPANSHRETISQDTKLTDILNNWLESIRVSAKHSTYVKYRNATVNHIQPDLGGMRLKAVTSSLINSFFLRKRGSGRLDKKGGLSSSTLHTLYVILSSALAYAAEDSGVFIPKLKPPHKDDPEIFMLEDEERKKLESSLLEHLDPSKFGILLCIYSGLRLGEVCSLKWEDIDLNSRVIRVRSTVQRIQMFETGSTKKTRLVVGLPKTKASIRDIPIHPFIMELIKRLSVPMDGYVISGNSMPLDPRTYQYRFKGFLKSADIQDSHFHVLRHTFATNCIASGVDVKSLSEILGHASVNTTLNKYVHSSIDMKHRQLEKLITILGHDSGIPICVSA